mmetsp:Transcript_20517/g.64991  ORF Transcript_20517/g.64991 Transcript_20517/m.64991 type:complete len:403 (+) Transcript_20517:116-1324(+)
MARGAVHGGQRQALEAAALLFVLVAAAAGGDGAGGASGAGDVANASRIVARLEAPLTPGTAANCWERGHNYEQCCLLENDSCWDTTFTRTVCCSAFWEAFYQALQDGELLFAPMRSAVQPNAGTSPELLACVQKAEHGSPHERACGPREYHVLCQNDFIRAAECIAQRPGTDVILDLFLGAGCSASAMAYGLGHQGPQSSRARPPELFSFERNGGYIRRALSPQGNIGRGLRRGWWRVARANASDPADYMALQARLAARRQPASAFAAPSASASHPVTVWPVHGSPYPPAAVDIQYRWNALDVLCQHLAPLDMVLIDSSAEPLDKEWMIIEFVCRPRWVLIFNLNIRSGSGWVFHRLELLGYWQLELRGHFALHGEPWGSPQEAGRVRSWAVFSRQTGRQQA